MLHDLFTIRVNGTVSGGWIRPMPTVEWWMTSISSGKHSFFDKAYIPCRLIFVCSQIVSDVCLGHTAKNQLENKSVWSI